MKWTEKKNLKTLQVILMGACLGLQMTSAFAQDFDVDDTIYSDQLDIDGDYQRKTDFSKKRKKIEQNTNDLVDKKIEDIRVKHEKKLSNDLRGIFGGGQDQVSTKQAAPHVEAAPVIIKKTTQSVLLTPYIGAAKITTEDFDIDWQSQIALGLKFDFLLNSFVSLGVNLNYTKTEAQDFSFDNYRGNQCFDSFDCGFLDDRGGRQIDYNRLSLLLTSRFFLIRNERVRPYIGLGLGVARNSLSFDNEFGGDNFGRGQFINDQDFNNAEYDSTSFTGSINAGTDFFFNDTIGVNVDLTYARSFGSDNQNELRNRGFNEDPDNRFLRILGQDLESANFISASLGLVIGF